MLNENFSENADSLMKDLKTGTVLVQDLSFKPIHNQPVLKKIGLFKTDTFPVVNELPQKDLYS